MDQRMKESSKEYQARVMTAEFASLKQGLGGVPTGECCAWTPRPSPSGCVVLIRTDSQTSHVKVQLFSGCCLDRQEHGL